MIRGAHIIFNRGKSIIPCTVVDFTEEGAAVRPVHDGSFPRFFILELSDGRRFNCERIDRTKGVIDLKFGK